MQSWISLTSVVISLVPEAMAFDCHWSTLGLKRGCAHWMCCDMCILYACLWPCAREHEKPCAGLHSPLVEV